ncbi:MAG: DUF6705 family protein [Flavobacteriaceae bacterium]|nr:DUF6705 family protein [Flavobacteriaceae bacterium]
MKNLIITIFVLSLFGCKAQIIPIEEYRMYRDNEIEIIDGTYIKDVNNLLANFIGTWKGTYRSINYEFRIRKETVEYLGIKEDQLLMRYKITDSNGVLIENTLLLPNDSPFVMKNGYMDESKGYVFSYIGRDVACSQNGWVFTQVYGSNNDKLQLFLSVEGEIYPECSTGEADQILPLESIELTKQ